MPVDPHRAQELFEQALERAPGERTPFLDSACGQDADLRARVGALLDAHAAAGEFLAEPAPTAGSGSESEGAIIGRYKLLERIGEGGMGSIWMAEQREPVKRRVALKIIKLGMDTKQVIARFEAERQALAMMDHPNIAKVLDAGATDTGRPYFVMEYIRGTPIVEYCDQERADTETRLQLFSKVCHAIQHAHQKGIIHRDIKPSNVLVTLHDGVPVPKVIDFGIAKATNGELTARTLFTEHRQMIGTPAYMSPEQTEMSGLGIDTRSDVYSLGVLLYELLTGTTPFAVSDLLSIGFDEVMRTIREVEPQTPSRRISTLGGSGTPTAQQRQVDLKRLGTLLRGDLDWIVMRCLEKDRTRRYATANELAADIARHLDDEPVTAGPPSASYRLRKFVRRNRGQVLAGGAVAVVLVLGLVTTLAFYAGALRARQDAEDSAREAKRQESIAVEEARVASERAAEIERQRGELRARTDEFDMLATVVHLRTAKQEEAQLYPPWPEKVEAMQAWLAEDAERLRQASGPVRMTVAALRSRTLSTEAELDAQRHAHAGQQELEHARAKREALLRARAVCAEPATFVAVPLPAELFEADARMLNEFAWPRVECGRQRHLEEGPALAAARRAVARVEGGDRSAELYAVLDTLAWALVACGLAEEALATSERALRVAPPEEKAVYEQFLEQVREHAEGLAGDAGAKSLREVEREIQELERRVEDGLALQFEAESDRFLFETLRALSRDLESFERGVRAGVEERLSWAKNVWRLTIGHRNARVTWAAARAAILQADDVVASQLYAEHPIDLAPQTGLVPIGMNPVTKLWEFYHLRSAWDPASGIEGAEQLEIPVHDPATGHIAVGDGTGIVFVLIPGGTFTMGATRSPTGPNFDPDTGNDETPHQVTLSPYFIGRHALTQGQWERLRSGDLPARPSYFAAGKPNFVGGMITLAHPVEQVDYEMCASLLTRQGLLLPTEAQWEYACRAGTTTPWWSGQQRESLRAHGIVANLADGTAKRADAGFDRIADWPDLEDGHVVHAPVDALRANPWGLHHVHGNVWEWCRDWFGWYELPWAEGDGLRRVDPVSSTLRVARGGGFNDAARHARSAIRRHGAPTHRGDNLGVRPARGITAR